MRRTYLALLLLVLAAGVQLREDDTKSVKPSSRLDHQLREAELQPLDDLKLSVVRREAGPQEKKKAKKGKRGKKGRRNGAQTKITRKNKGSLNGSRRSNKKNGKSKKSKKNGNRKRKNKKGGRKKLKGGQKKKNRQNKKKGKGKRKGKGKKKCKGSKCKNKRQKIRTNQRQSNCSVLTCLNEMVFSLKIEKDTVRNFLAQEKRVNAKTNLMSKSTLY